MILVTGGTGLLGSHLLYALLTQGKKVRATRRKHSNTLIVEKIFSYYTEDPYDLFNSIEWVEADLQDYTEIENAVQGAEEVYHCAAMVSFKPQDHALIQKVNVDSTANLVNLSLHHGVKKFCHVSSVATLGRADHDGYTDEETWWRTSKKNTMYSISKYGAEREVWRGMEEGLRAVIVNPSVILGPGFWNGNSGLFRLVDKGLKYYTEGINGYVDVRDVADAMILLMEKELFDHRFVLNSENLSYKDFFTLIAKYLDKPAPHIEVAPYLKGIAWRYEYLRSFLTGGRPEITAEMATTAMQKYFYSSDKIRKMAGFGFRPVEQSVREFSELYQKDKKVKQVTTTAF